MDKSSVLTSIKNEIKLRNFSLSTSKSYLWVINDFLKSSSNLDNLEVKEYLLKAINNKESTSSVKTKYSALKLMFYAIGKRAEFDIPKYKRESRLPEVLNKTDVNKILGSIKNLMGSL